MTVVQSLNLMKEYHWHRLNQFERNAVDGFIHGIGCADDAPDQEVLDYINEKQIAWIRTLAKRFSITENTKL